MRARSQYYAEAIYECVQSVPEERRTKYGALCYRFPLIVRENGLTAALGFLSAKGGTDIHSPENLLLGHYAVVLGANDPDDLRQTTIAANLIEYRRLTSQTLSAAEWFKRYAEAVLKVDATGIREENEENEDA